LINLLTKETLTDYNNDFADDNIEKNFKKYMLIELQKYDEMAWALE
jgi:hypothetical protein